MPTTNWHRTIPIKHALAWVVLCLSLWALQGCASNATSANAPVATVAAKATAQEQSALAPTGTLRVGVYNGSPTSLVIQTQTGQRAGVALELGQQLGAALGVPVQVIEFSRVAEIVDALKQQQIDMTFTNASAARARELDFTATLIQLELGLLAPADSALRSLDDLDKPGMRVGVSQGSSSQVALTPRLKQAQVVTSASMAQTRQMLQRGEIQAFATNKGILFEQASQLPGFRVLDSSWGFENLAIAVPKGRDAGLPYLNTFAQAVRTNGRLSAMAQRAGLRGIAP
jgi:polar amino acid transport system substrate-binding protein